MFNVVRLQALRLSRSDGLSVDVMLVVVEPSASSLVHLLSVVPCCVLSVYSASTVRSTCQFVVPVSGYSVVYCACTLRCSSRSCALVPSGWFLPLYCRYVDGCSAPPGRHTWKENSDIVFTFVQLRLVADVTNYCVSFVA